MRNTYKRISNYTCIYGHVGSELITITSIVDFAIKINDGIFSNENKIDIHVNHSIKQDAV